MRGTAKAIITKSIIEFRTAVAIVPPFELRQRCCFIGFQELEMGTHSAIAVKMRIIVNRMMTAAMAYVK